MIRKKQKQKYRETYQAWFTLHNTKHKIKIPPNKIVAPSGISLTESAAQL